MASKKKKSRYIENFLKRADKAVEDGIKRADEILDDAAEYGMIASKQAKITSDELRKQAKKEGEQLKSKGVKKITEGIFAAKKITSSNDEDLKTLERLGKLRKSGIITEKEFQAKKKKILSRI